MMRAFMDVLAASSVARSFVSELSVFRAVKVCFAYTALSEHMSVSLLISVLGIWPVLLPWQCTVRMLTVFSTSYITTW